MIRVVVVDDHPVVADSLGATIGTLDDIEVVACAHDAASGIAALVEHEPDVALIDFRLPDRSGTDLVRDAATAVPGCKCVILTGTGQERALLEAVEAGAVGFVTKDQRFSDVVTAIRAAAQGAVTFPPVLLAKVLPDLRRATGQDRRLTDRERSVLELLVDGRSNAEIGTALHISTNTVRNHVANLLTKLAARSRGEAVAIALKDGLVTPPAN